MRKPISILLFGVMIVTAIVGFIPSSFATSGSISVSTDKSSYNYGDTIVISGHVSSVIPNQTITLQIEDPNGLGQLVSVSPNLDGSFSYQIYANTNDTGGYTVTARYDSAVNQTTFSYVGSQSQSIISQSQPSTPQPVTSAPSINAEPALSQTEVQYSIPQWVKNTAKWWADGQISDSEFVKAVQYLIDNNILTGNEIINEINQLQSQNQAIRQAAIQTTNEINQLQQENYNLQTENENLKLQVQQDNDKLNEWNDYYNKVQTWAQNYNNTLQQALQNYNNAIQQALQVSQCTPLTSVKNGTISWNFCDSKGNQYTWSMPFTTYDTNIKRPFPTDTISIKEPDGTIAVFPNYAEFVEPSFSKVIDRVYDNAGSDDQFLYEVWFIVSQMTTYSQDITNSNLWPLQTFSDARGDCKDLSILVASMIRSSSHTQNWQVYLGIVDSNNPSNPQHYNHMMVSVHIGNEVQFIEATAKQDGLHSWDNTTLSGYWLPVGNTSQ